MGQPTLVILAAGMGSRYGGLKQMDPVGPSGETILDYSVYDARRAGFGKVVFVVRDEMRGPFAAQVAARFAGAIEVGYAVQRLCDLPAGTGPLTAGRSKPWGTAHAVLAAREVVDNPFVVANADDFYGLDAYQQAARFLVDDSHGATAYAMVGFTLRQTLSDHGSVARGICQTDRDGFLVRVEEFTKIERRGNGARNSFPDGGHRDLTGDEPASMNFWALRPAAFAQFESVFREFLADPSNHASGEFYIPVAIDRLIRTGEATVRVLRTASPWFGVTYREDREAVVTALRALVDAGTYPRDLWV
jgi:dTDP-glucose pyrophosphorylase